MRAALLLICACARRPFVPSNAAEVDHVAVLEQTDGIYRGRLQRWTARPIELHAESDAILAGFSEEQLAGYAFEGGELVEASGCEPALPPPIWAASWIADTVDEIAPSEVPKLTAAFVADACPEAGAFSIFIDSTCEDSFCPNAVTRLGSCVDSIDLGCGLGSATASIDRNGEVCVDFSTWDCAAIDPLPGANASRSCTAPRSCTFSAYAAPAGEPPPFQIESLALFPADDWVHPILARRDYLGSRMMRSGYAFDLVLLDDRAVVTAGEGPAQESCPSGDQHARRLHFVDLETFAPMFTATAPPCLDELGVDPIGDGFLGNFEQNGTWMIGRFDRDGALLASSPSAPPPGDYKAFGIESPDPNTIAVLYTVAEVSIPGPPRSVLHLYDADTLALRDTYEYEIGARTAITVPAPGIVAMTSSDPRFVHGLSIDLGADDWNVPIYGNSPFTQALFDVVPGDAPGTVLAAGSDPAGLYAVDGREGRVERSDAYALDSVPLTAARWEGDLFLVSLMEIAVDAGWLALYDAKDRAFRPSVWRMGIGPIRRIEIDRTGRAWFLMAWSARMFRATR